MKSIVRKSGLFLTGVLFMACATAPKPTPVSYPAPVVASAPVAAPTRDPAPAASKPADELDAAIRETSDYLNKQLPAGNKLVFLNIQSAYPALSEYIIDELIANTVNDRVFTAVDRQQLDALRQELDFQMTGEVDDDTAQALGRIAGAQIIVSGAVSKFGDLYRLRVRALNVQTAAIEGQFNRNIPDGPTIGALARSQATGYGGDSGAASGGPTTEPPTPATSDSVTPAQATSNPPAPTSATPVQVAASGVQPGLYVGDTFQGEMNLYDALDWITLNVQANGVYTFVMESDQRVSNVSLDYGGKRVTIFLKATGGERKVTYDIAKPSYALFTVKAGVTFIIEENVVLAGVQEAGGRLVAVDSGTFIMNGGTVKDNKNGGGVSVTGGTFTMNDGTISGNTASSYGGGVRVDAGSTFTMHKGVISGNTASSYGGGGVYVNGTFTMNDGTISGNASSGGGGVYVNSGTFTMNDGTISGNTAGGNGGGGVCVGGTFTMKNGTISGNTTGYRGGGVRVFGGTFTMHNGTINGNTASGAYGDGGGVGVESSTTFTMNDGTISGNTASSGGGGVFVESSGTFTKSGRGGIIYGVNATEGANSSQSGNGHAVYVYSIGGIRLKRDNTVRVTLAMDSTKSGPEGGWD